MAEPGSRCSASLASTSIDEGVAAAAVRRVHLRMERRLERADRAQLVEALEKQVRAIGGVPIPYFDEFAALFRHRALEKGEHFARAGELPTSVGFVYSGIARMYYTRRDGKEFNKGFVSAPDFVSALEALITKTPTPLAIRALTPMQLLVAPYDGVAGFFERDMYWQRLGRLVVEHVYVKKARREASLLMNTAAERYEQFLAEHRQIAGQVPDYHIASYLGITPQALSRLRHARTM